MRWPWLVVVALLVAGCTNGDVPGQPTPSTPAPTGGPAPSPTPSPPSPGPSAPRFDGGRAYDHVVAQIEGADGGPRYRVPGTEGNREVARYIDATMSALGYSVTWHHFNATYGCETVAMHNVVAERAGSSGKTVAFAAHYDTRPIADKDPDPRSRGEPVLGANDGASGVAVLLELARVLPPSNDTVRFLFFDGEDGGGYKAPLCKTDWILGSRAYAQSLSAEEVASFRAFVLVDMVGDPALLLPREGYSRQHAGGALVQADVYATARALGHEEFLDQDGPAILDDHVPFLERDIPAVDLIHTIPGDPRVFPVWHHTLEDDLDVVSAESLAAVGETLERWFAERG